MQQPSLYVKHCLLYVQQPLLYVNTSYFATGKVFFYDAPDENAINKKYLVEGDVCLIQKTQNGFGYTTFTNERGIKTTGWLKMNELKINDIFGTWQDTKHAWDNDEYFNSLVLEKDGTAKYEF